MPSIALRVPAMIAGLALLIPEGHSDLVGLALGAAVMAVALWQKSRHACMV